jgi:hypothetical protein
VKELISQYSSSKYSAPSEHIVSEGVYL